MAVQGCMQSLCFANMKVFKFVFISQNPWFTCVDSSSEYPGPCCHGSLDEPFAKDLLEFGLQFKVLQAPVD